MPKAKVPLNDQFLAGWEKYGLEGSDITTEYQFHLFRKWRFDIAFPTMKLGIELDGMGWGHQSVAARQRDIEKQNAATELGWRVLRYTSKQLTPTTIEATIEQVRKVLCGLD